MLKILEYIKKIENSIIFNIKHPCNVSMHNGFGNCLIITTYVHVFNKDKNKNLSFERVYYKDDLNSNVPTDSIIDLYIEEASQELLTAIKN